MQVLRDASERGSLGRSGWERLRRARSGRLLGLSRNHAVGVQSRSGCSKVGQRILPAQDGFAMEPDDAGVSGRPLTRKPTSARGRLEARPTFNCIGPADPSQVGRSCCSAMFQSPLRTIGAGFSFLRVSNRRWASCSGREELVPAWLKTAREWTRSTPGSISAKRNIGASGGKQSKPNSSLNRRKRRPACPRWRSRESSRRISGRTTASPGDGSAWP